MLASSAPGAAQRIARARRAALLVRAQLPGVPVGIASVNDRVLPHLFPSPDRAAFSSTITRTIRPGQPIPVGAGRTGTNLTALVAVPTLNFFAPESLHRAVVVITDAESDPVDINAIARGYRTAPAAELVVLGSAAPTRRSTTSGVARARLRRRHRGSGHGAARRRCRRRPSVHGGRGAAAARAVLEAIGRRPDRAPRSRRRRTPRTRAGRGAARPHSASPGCSGAEIPLTACYTAARAAA